MENEVRTPGGEVTFVKQYMLEAWQTRKRDVWYTVMLGVKTHVELLKQYVRTQFPAVRSRSCTLKQGKTWRWGLAWQFLPI